jgi:hypothetical protein
MSFIGSLLGGNDGAGYVAPTSSNLPIVNPVTATQTDAAYSGVQNGLNDQNAFVNALNQQGGVKNQTNALNQQAGLTNALAAQNGAATQQQALQAQQQLAAALAGQNGVANQSSVFNQQQGLANQFQNVANGTGPNPAQAALAQATGNNVANQAALMASQRGAGANAGLIARQAALAGTNAQQQAVGQSATLQAQQQIAGLQGLQNQQAQLANTAQTQIANQAAQQGAVAGLASTQINQQQTANNALASQAAQQVAQQQGALTAQNQAQQSEQANLLGGVANSNSTQASLQNNENSSNTTIQAQNAKTQQGLLGGVLSGIGAVLADGGVVGKDGNMPPKFASGGAVPGAYQAPASGPQSNVGKFLYSSAGEGQTAPVTGPQPDLQSTMNAENPVQVGTSQLVGKFGADIVKPGIQSLMAPSIDADGIGSQFNSAGAAPSLGMDLALAKGGEVKKPAPKVKALVSPGEIYLTREQAMQAANGKIDPMKAGKKVPGKAKVAGDSYDNDTVPAKLEKGGIVLPRSVTESPNPHWAAHAFVKALMARKGGLNG